MRNPIDEEDVALVLATLTACGSTPPAPPAAPPTPSLPGGPPPAVGISAEERQRAAVAELAGDYQQVTMHVTAAGFEPRVLRVQTGIPTKLVVIRDVEETCPPVSPPPNPLDSDQAGCYNTAVVQSLPPAASLLRGRFRGTVRRFLSLLSLSLIS